MSLLLFKREEMSNRSNNNKKKKSVASVKPSPSAKSSVKPSAATKPSTASARPDPSVRKQGIYSHPSNKCSEITTSRTRCNNDALTGSMFCTVHRRRPQQHEDEFFDSTFARVHERVWIGSLDTANDPRALRSAGIKGVVNISGWEPRKKTRDMYRLWKPQPIKYFTTTTRDASTGRLRYLGDEPIRDRQSLMEFYRYMDRGVEMIERCMRETRGDCLVNCHAGINRSASLIAAWLMSKRGLTFLQARALLEAANRKRKIPVLTNSDFVKALARYEHRQR